MENWEEKFETILKNPQMMEQIMSMAKALGNSAPVHQDTTPESGQLPQNESKLDLSILQKLSGLASQGNIDRDQKQLLQALRPYLSKDRVTKLENAMRAAKLAKIASAFLSNGGMQIISGR